MEQKFLLPEMGWLTQQMLKSFISKQTEPLPLRLSICSGLE